jgi:LuxR family maltose regulon positive regulatory protein
VFLVALDGEQEWYRYHQLFADLLRARLAQSEPDLLPVLWRRAADWCAGQGLVEEAVRYALRAGDQHRAAELVLGHGPPALRRGGVATARAWLSLLPDELRPPNCNHERE